MLSLLLVGLILTVIFAGCGVVVKKFLVDKKYFGSSQFVGREVYKALQSADRKESVEHIIYMEEDDDRREFTADEVPGYSDGIS